MTSVGIVVGWKFGHPEGICTRGGLIEQWPASANEGMVPMPDEIDAWRKEYEARPKTVADLTAAQRERLDEALRTEFLQAHPDLAKEFGLGG